MAKAGKVLVVDDYAPNVSGLRRLLEAHAGAIHGLAFVEHPRALPLLVRLARAPAAKTRAAAMRGLGQSAGGPEVASVLLEGLGDPDTWVRYYAAQSIGKLHLGDIRQNETGTSHYDYDLYHYDLDALHYACEGTSLSFAYEGEFEHPNNQKMVVFTRE